MTNTDTLNTLKQLSSNIEMIARQVRSSLDSGGDVLGSANELVRNSIGLVFTLGESYAQNNGTTAVTAKATKATVTKKGNANYHNVRDNRGRFTSKV